MKYQTVHEGPAAFRSAQIAAEEEERSMRRPSRKLRPRTWLAAMVACVIAGALSAPGATAATPQNDPFYTPPSPLPAGQPGDLIRSRPITVFGAAKAFQILYLSTN